MEPRKHQLEALEAINSTSEGIIHLPTGTGKTFIQALSIKKGIPLGWKWLKKNNLKEEIPVFVVLSPRIILSNQLFSNTREILLDKGLDCHYLIVHSGKTRDNMERIWTSTQPYRELKSTTKSYDIISEYQKAKAEKVPLIIFGTYDSAKRIIQSKIPVYMLDCDEAQHLVSREFHWISMEENNSDHPIKYFNAVRKYYYTATLKETFSSKGLGMNNSNVFGPILYSKTPLEMISAGEIIRPRIHLVDIKNDSEEISDLEKDINAIIESFIEHTIHVSTGAKLLIVTKGSKHLNEIASSRKMKRFLEIRPNLKIFDISSQYKPRINGEIVRREYFLSSLQDLGDSDEAIILHIDIISEGIDVPGITGIMPMNSMGLAKFLQTLGRATRLHIIDRRRLYSKDIKYSELERFVKRYAWIIIPIYGVLGEDEKEKIKETIDALRGHDFDASEDVVIRDDRGEAYPQPLAGINQKNTRAIALLNIFIQVQHEIEEQEKADKIAIEEFKESENIKKKTMDQLISFFENE